MDNGTIDYTQGYPVRHPVFSRTDHGQATCDLDRLYAEWFALKGFMNSDGSNIEQPDWDISMKTLHDLKNVLPVRHHNRYAISR